MITIILSPKSLENKRMSIYLGFDLQSMLFRLNEYCESVTLCKSNNEWRLHVISDDYGEYENTGSLFYITSQAFKPFVDRAKKERATAKEQLDKIITNTKNKQWNPLTDPWY